LAAGRKADDDRLPWTKRTVLVLNPTPPRRIVRRSAVIEARTLRRPRARAAYRHRGRGNRAAAGVRGCRGERRRAADRRARRVAALRRIGRAAPSPGGDGT